MRGQSSIAGTALAAASALLAAPALAQDKSLHDVKEMQSMQMTGEVDKDFAMMMKHHHQSGIDMAHVQVRAGKDPELKKMAQKIIDAQKKEIGELTAGCRRKAIPPDAKSGASGHGGGSSGHSGPGHSGHK